MERSFSWVFVCWDLDPAVTATQDLFGSITIFLYDIFIYWIARDIYKLSHTVHYIGVSNGS